MNDHAVGDWGARPRPWVPFRIAIWLLVGASVLVFIAVALIGIQAEGPAQPLFEKTWAVFARSGRVRWAAGIAATGLGFLALGGLCRLVLAFLGQAERAAYGPLSGTERRALLAEVRKRLELLQAEQNVPPSRVLDEIFRGALRLQASDIHLNPSSLGGTLALRIDGSITSIGQVNSGLCQSLVIRIKVLARLDTYGKKPQDGRLTHTIDGEALEARVSTLQAESGERVVLRLVRGARAVPAISQLGLTEPVARSMELLLAKSQGILFLSGPVGSGKTTTLYSALSHIGETRGGTTSIVSIEDPIELKLPFLTQIQVNPKLGMSFAQTLRSVLRQDPNVLMIGEIRDKETAEIATQAGLTGHLILTTIHVDSAAGTFARLADMGIEPFAYASATVGCLSQRLVRTLCTHCRVRQEPDPWITERLEKLGLRVDLAEYWAPKGCDFCDHQGFVGRVPIAELLTVTTEMRSLIHARSSTAEIEALSRAAGSVPLIESALDLALKGATSLGEVLRVAG